MKESVTIALRIKNAPFLDIFQYTENTKEAKEALLRNLLQAFASFKNRYNREPKTNDEWLAVASYLKGDNIELIFDREYNSYMINNGKLYFYELGEDFELREIENNKGEDIIVINIDTLVPFIAKILEEEPIYDSAIAKMEEIKATKRGNCVFTLRAIGNKNNIFTLKKYFDCDRSLHSVMQVSSKNYISDAISIEKTDSANGSNKWQYTFSGTCLHSVYDSLRNNIFNDFSDHIMTLETLANYLNVQIEYFSIITNKNEAEHAVITKQYRNLINEKEKTFSVVKKDYKTFAEFYEANKKEIESCKYNNSQEYLFAQYSKALPNDFISFGGIGNHNFQIA